MVGIGQMVKSSEVSLSMASDKILEVVDPTGLTDADWGQINALRALYESSGAEALDNALERLSSERPGQFIRIAAALDPASVRDATKDELADKGITEQDVSDLLKRLNAPTREH